MSDIPVICRTCDTSGMVALATVDEALRCACGSTDLDLDDGQPVTAAGREVTAAGPGGPPADDYRVVEIDSPIAPPFAVEGDFGGHWERLMFFDTREKAEVWAAGAPRFTASLDEQFARFAAGRVFEPGTISENDSWADTVEEVEEVARCSACFHEWTNHPKTPADPVPPCPNCGSEATSTAGATNTHAATRKQAWTGSADEEGNEVILAILQPLFDRRLSVWSRQEYGGGIGYYVEIPDDTLRGKHMVAMIADNFGGVSVSVYGGESTDGLGSVQEAAEWVASEIQFARRQSSSQAASDYKACPSCGSNNHGNAARCAHCGAVLSGQQYGGSRKQAVSRNVLYDIQRRDPDGGSIYPTAEMYAGFERWVRSTYGDQAWRVYKGEDWAEDIEDDVPGAEFHASKQAVKITCPKCHGMFRCHEGHYPTGRETENKCSQCYGRFRDHEGHYYDPSLYAAGSRRLTPAQAAKAVEIAEGIRRTNPGLPGREAKRIAEETVRRYPKVAAKTASSSYEKGKAAYEAGEPRVVPQEVANWHGEPGDTDTAPIQEWYRGWDEANVADDSWEH